MTDTPCDIMQIGSGDFLQDMASRPIPVDELPLAGSFELTFKCNLSCRHCYIGGNLQRKPELSTIQVKELINRLRSSGVLILLMTGGEPLVRADFQELYQYARCQGLLVSVYTNATLVDVAMADFFAANPPRRMEVTVYGHTAETYEKVTGVPGSFAAFRSGVALLLERQLPLHFKAMVLKSNQHEIQAIKSWVESLGKTCRLDAVVNPGLDGCMSPLKERLPSEELSMYLPHASDAESGDNPDLHLFKCGAGLKSFHIDPVGFIHPCMMWRSDPYDFLAGTVAEWKQQVHHLRERMMPSDSNCITCPKRAVCPNCPAISHLETQCAGMHVPDFCAALGHTT